MGAKDIGPLCIKMLPSKSVRLGGEHLMKPEHTSCEPCTSIFQTRLGYCSA